MCAMEGRRRKFLFFVLVVSLLPHSDGATTPRTTAPRRRPTPCDYSTGSWVYDPSAFPRYKSTACYSRMRDVWNCQKNGRTNRAFEKYKWVPTRCSMPYFDAARFLNLLRNKDFAIVGDSLMQNLYEGLGCLLSSKKFRYRSFKRTYAGRTVRGLIFRDYSFRLVYFASNYLMRATNIPGTGAGGKRTDALAVDMDVPDPIWTKALTSFDVLVFGSGHWWNTYVPNRVVPNVYRRRLRPVNITSINAYRRGLGTLNTLFDKTRYSGIVYFMSYSPSHYLFDYKSKNGACGATKPLNPRYLRRQLRKGGAGPYLKAEGGVFSSSRKVRYLDVTTLSQYRADSHTGLWSVPGGKANRSDCTHWCLPGVPDAWADYLYANLLLEPYLTG